MFLLRYNGLFISDLYHFYFTHSQQFQRMKRCSWFAVWLTLNLNDEVIVWFYIYVIEESHIRHVL